LEAIHKSTHLASADVEVIDGTKLFKIDKVLREYGKEDIINKIDVNTSPTKTS
jgi:hypothetical protein